ncbi:hypothetical protein MN608_11930 [Microdochium nivale]|nr:hypothetical protein MN608_11930 [Microdochium nivale]
MDTGNIFCSICGHVFVHEAHAELVRGMPTGWQCDAVLLSDPAHEFERLEVHYRAGRTASIMPIDFTTATVSGTLRDVVADVDIVAIVEEQAVYMGHELFQLLRSGNVEDDGFVQVNEHVGQEAWEGGSSTYRIAVHPACLAVARDYYRAQDIAATGQGSQQHGTAGAGHAAARGLRTLWKVLRTRWDALDAMLMVTDGSIEYPAYGVLGAHAVYDPLGPGAMEAILQRRWNPSEQAEPVTMTKIVIAVASPLPTTAASDPTAEQFRARLYRLPRELQDMILGFVATSETGEWGAECNRLLSPEAWRDLLIDGRVLQFIGALDRDTFAWATTARQDLDYEAIIRKFSQPAHPATGYWHELGDVVPDWLRSRRWRWELLGRMYVGDVLPTWHEWMQRESDVPAIPTYWNRDGRRVYPVRRVTGCA